MKESYCLRCDQPIEDGLVHYGQHIACFQKVFSVSKALPFHSLTRKESSSQEKQKKQLPHLTSYFAGNYKKYEGKLDDASYILKFSKPDYPELAPVEYVCNKIAYFCGIEIPTPFTLIRMTDHEMAFVSKNFMQPTNVHCTLVHLYHYLEQGISHYTVENISEVIYRETQSAKDVATFLKTVLFDALIGNHDRHGSNLAFVETAHEKKLAPIYDNPSYLGLESTLLGAHFSPQGKIQTMHSTEPRMLEYLDEINRIGALDIALDFFKKISMATVQKVIMDAVCLSDPMKKALLKLINERYEEFKKYVENQ